MRLCHQMLPGASPAFEILDGQGRIVWQGERRDEVIEILAAAGVKIPECLLQPHGAFEVELSSASPRVSQNRAELLTSVDRILSRRSE